jgi:hypothetical protein
MNTSGSGPFASSVDNKENPQVATLMDSAANLG